MKGAICNMKGCVQGLQDLTLTVEQCSQSLDVCTNGGDCRVAAAKCKALTAAFNKTLADCRGKKA